MPGQYETTNYKVVFFIVAYSKIGLCSDFSILRILKKIKVNTYETFIINITTLYDGVCHLPN